MHDQYVYIYTSARLEFLCQNRPNIVLKETYVSKETYIYPNTR